MIDDQTLAEWRRLADAATEGDGFEISESEFALFAAAREAIPQLLDEVERLQLALYELTATEPKAYERGDCGYCQKPVGHYEDCPWRRAREMTGKR